MKIGGGLWERSGHITNPYYNRYIEVINMYEICMRYGWDIYERVGTDTTLSTPHIMNWGQHFRRNNSHQSGYISVICSIQHDRDIGISEDLSYQLYPMPLLSAVNILCTWCICITKVFYRLLSQIVISSYLNYLKNKMSLFIANPNAIIEFSRCGNNEARSISITYDCCSLHALPSWSMM